MIHTDVVRSTHLIDRERTRERVRHARNPRCHAQYFFVMLSRMPQTTSKSIPLTWTILSDLMCCVSACLWLLMCRSTESSCLVYHIYAVGPVSLVTFVPLLPIHSDGHSTPKSSSPLECCLDSTENKIANAYWCFVCHAFFSLWKNSPPRRHEMSRSCNKKYHYDVVLTFKL